MTTEELQTLLDAATPGPWIYDPDAPFNAYSDDATGSIVATAGGFQYAPRPGAEKIANARAIATWPTIAAELIAARKAVAAWEAAQ